MSISNGNSTKPITDPVIPNELITDFAKTTNDTSNKNKNDGSVCGTTVEKNGKMYVMIDGSDVLTPVITTADIRNNERVIVQIKDHLATVTGNITSPSASSTVVDKVTQDVDKVTQDMVDVENTVTDMGTQIEKIETTVNDRVTIVEHKVTDSSIISIVTGSEEWYNASGGVNVIPNGSASIDLDGWSPAEGSSIVRYSTFESSIGPAGTTSSTTATGSDDVRTPEIHMIEPYGGGLAMLIIDCNNKVVFIDGGYSGNGNHCVQYMKSLGVNKIDFYIITHCHTDHGECAPIIFNNIPVQNVVIKKLVKSKLPQIEFEWMTDIVYDNIMAECNSRKINTIEPRSCPYIILSDNSNLRLYNTNNTKWDNYNHQSLMVLYTYKNSKIFMAGDGTNHADISVLGDIGAVDILQLGHHGDGSIGGSSQALIDELQPKHAYFASAFLATPEEETMETETLKRVSFVGGLSYGHGPGHNGDFKFVINGSGVSTSAISTRARDMWYEREKGSDIWYWFKSDGSLAKNETLTISGVSYTFDSDGICTNPWG